MNYWKQLNHVMKYFRAEEDPKMALPKNFISGFLEVNSDLTNILEIAETDTRKGPQLENLIPLRLTCPKTPPLCDCTEKIVIPAVAGQYWLAREEASVGVVMLHPFLCQRRPSLWWICPLPHRRDPSNPSAPFLAHRRRSRHLFLYVSPSKIFRIFPLNPSAKPALHIITDRMSVSSNSSSGRKDGELSNRRTQHGGYEFVSLVHVTSITTSTHFFMIT